MKNKRTGDLNDLGLETVLIWGGIAFGAWYLINNFSSLFGGSNDDVLSAEMGLPASQNPFSYQFQPFIDFYNANTPTITTDSGSGWAAYLGFGSNVPATTSPTIQQFFVSLKQSPPTSSSWGFLDVVSLSAMAENIYSAMEVGWGVTTNQTQAVSSVSNFSNQLQVAFVANYLWYNYNVSMLAYLHGSLTQGGLTQANLDQLITTVNNLPVNPS